MKLLYTPSASTVKPDVIAIEKTTVYLRKDIVEKTCVDISGDETVFYTYQEAALSHEEFSKYSNGLAAINAVKGVNDSENQYILMEAIADLYDIIASLS